MKKIEISLGEKNLLLSKKTNMQDVEKYTSIIGVIYCFYYFDYYKNIKAKEFFKGELSLGDIINIEKINNDLYLLWRLNDRKAFLYLKESKITRAFESYTIIKNDLCVLHFSLEKKDNIFFKLSKFSASTSFITYKDLKNGYYLLAHKGNKKSFLDVKTLKNTKKALIKKYKKIQDNIYLIEHSSSDSAHRVTKECNKSLLSLSLLKFSEVKFKSYRRQKEGLCLLNLGDNYRSYLRLSDFEYIGAFECERFQAIDDNYYISSGRGMTSYFVDFTDFCNVGFVEIYDAKRFQRLNDKYYVFHENKGETFFLNLDNYRLFETGISRSDTRKEIKDNIFLFESNDGYKKMINFSDNKIHISCWFKSFIDLCNGSYLLKLDDDWYTLCNLESMDESESFEKYTDLKNGFYLISKIKKIFLRLSDGKSSQGYHFNEYKNSKCISEFGSIATFNFETMEMSSWRFL